MRNITELQQKDILELFTRASKKIFIHYPQYQSKMSSMMELKIKTLSMQLAEMDEQLAAYRAELADKDATIADKGAELADKDVTIAALKKQFTLR